jgi:hypothetical protein
MKENLRGQGSVYVEGAMLGQMEFFMQCRRPEAVQTITECTIGTVTSHNHNDNNTSVLILLRNDK